ncbi:hypothetical protein DRN52_06445 [Thermococci archaeon]|nr:MAG: hypothetical protein DRN52_06445 [Thermococci archaeon]
MKNVIKTLEIKNFKSIKQLKLDCGRVNVFIGEPNTGKSNILEALGLLSYICYGSPASLSSFVRFENFDDLFYDRNLDESMKIGFVLLSGEHGSLEVSYKDMRFKGSFKGRLNGRDIDTSVFEFDFEDSRDKTSLNELSLFKFYRFIVKSVFERPESDFLLPPHGDNLFSLLMGSKDIKSLASQILNQFGLKLVFNRVEKRIEVLKQYEDVFILFPYSLVSETIQRIIFYLAAIKSNKDSVLVFEEPEAHAFPFYTKYLAERIALDENNQYFISTHNPYLLCPIIEKAKSVRVFLTYLRGYRTKVKPLSKADLEKVLDLDLDVFFKIKELLGESKNDSR